jgi:hypothetical protein
MLLMSDLDNAERVREYYRKQGEKREQNRIIALLEAEITTLSIMGLFQQTDGLRGLINVIKEGNK